MNGRDKKIIKRIISQYQNIQLCKEMLNHDTTEEIKQIMDSKGYTEWDFNQEYSWALIELLEGAQ